MSQTRLATRIDERVQKAIEPVCKARDLKVNRFIEEALVDKLEELEDVEDLTSIRCESTRPLNDLIKDLGLDGEI